VRDAFRALGHDAWSCDIQPSSNPSEYHIQDDIRNVLDRDWDLLIGFPPCDFLTGANNLRGWWIIESADFLAGQDAALGFFEILANAPVPRIALENPVGYLSSLYRKPDQVIHPYQFGDPYTKPTCIWLKNLPKLIPSNIVEVERAWVGSYRTKGARDKNTRSLTFPGIARAMAEQWSNGDET
jgi:hypothetical protein